MIPDLSEYLNLAKDFDIVPVYRELIADTDTPVSVLQRFVDEENVFLLESMEGGETWGRYSFVGIRPTPLLEVDHTSCRPEGLDPLRGLYRDLRVASIPGLPRFVGGAVGFLGYEAAGVFESLPAPRPGSPGSRPVSRFLRADRLIVFDNVRHTVKIVLCTRPRESGGAEAAYKQCAAEMDDIVQRLRKPPPPVPLSAADPVRFDSNLSAERFMDGVRRAKEHIVAGDVIQVVLSRRFEAESRVHPFQVYRALRLLNPSPYTFFLKMGDHALVGSSPEVMVRLSAGSVEVRPIAGSRPRGGTEAEDRRMADELLSDEKERAEHLMLVDLGRNDLGRVSIPGSVQVTELMRIERYSHIMHLVSHVTGQLRRDCDALDVLRATFPAGTLTGAPKIRAMQIIHDLEPDPRGVYGGAVGYVGYDGNMDLAITIRTIEMERGKIRIQAGAGIVFDSVPEREFEETGHKARGMQLAVELAARELNLTGDEV
ncbi:MAG: anthranilate synthase component I family protein [Kiritimatiellia bacterium]|nr:anthranilate synthase component I family protein [Kiritimatiellia bacterium]